MDWGRWLAKGAAHTISRMRRGNQAPYFTWPWRNTSTASVNVRIVAAIQRADADNLPRDFLPALIADRHEHRVFPRLAAHGMPNRPFDPEWRKRRSRTRRRARLEPEVVLACRAHTRAIDNGCPAMGARPCRARGASRRTHAAEPLSIFITGLEAFFLYPIRTRPGRASATRRQP